MSLEGLPKQPPLLSRVLVVDDEEALARALCTRLQEEGYSATGVTSGVQALVALREQTFEVLLTDLMMPGMDGQAVLKAGLEIDPRLVGVVMTGQGTVESAVEAMKQGACDYVLKPFKMAELLVVLAKALELRRLRLENIDLHQTLALFELTTTLRFTQDLNAILDKTAEAALQQLGANEVSIMLPTKDGKELFVAAVRGGQRDHLLGSRLPFGEGVAGWVAHHREPLALEGSVQEGRFGVHTPRADIGTSLSLPMLAAGQLVGVLNLNAYTRRRAFSAGDIKSLQLLTSIAAEALAASYADQHVREAEDDRSLFRVLIDQSSDSIEILDPETGRFLDVNAKGCLDHGYSRQEFLALSVFDIDLVLDQASFSRAGEELRESGSLLWEGLHRRKNGSTFPVEVNLRYVQLERSYVVAVVRDISERKRAEAERRLQSAALNSADNAIVITDVSGAIEWVNPAFTRLTGYTFAEVVGKNPRLLKSDRHEPEFYQSLWATVLAGQVWRGETVNRRKDGSLYTETQTITPVLDESGVITHFIAIKEDISARLQLQAQLHQAQKMEALGQLAGGVAHDFNNLITVIDGYSRLALKHLPQEDSLLRSSVEEVQRAGERAEALIRQLLAFSRRQDSERQILDLNQVVSGVQKMLGRLIGEDVEMRVELSADAATVDADPGQLEQVLMNLVVNARDAMPVGGQLTIETALCQLDEAVARSLGFEGGGQYCRLAVQDTGVGMSAEVQQHIFEPFFTTKKAGKGTGLGLSTVYGIVKEHRGGIQVRSQEGKGTSFEIYLPVATNNGQENTQQRQVPARRGAEKVLLVEDDASVRKFVVRILGGLGYTVLEAGRAEEALQLCASHPQSIALLLTDVVLPGANGYALAAEVAVLHPGVKVLYMSGYAERGGHPQGTEVNFLAKPFTYEKLAHAVRQALDGPPPN